MKDCEGDSEAMSVCYQCRSAPTAPNYLVEYEDDLGEEYSVCAFCEDFERALGIATDGERDCLVRVEDYGVFRKLWEQEMERLESVIELPELSIAEVVLAKWRG